MSGNLAGNLALFLLGIIGLWALRRAYRDLLARRRASFSVWWETRELLLQRRETVARLATDLPPHRPVLLAALNALPALSSGDLLPTPDTLAAEQQLSGLVLHIVREHESDDAPPPALLDCEALEGRLAALRGAYNRHALVWNDGRSAFPNGIIARALLADPLPLWEGAKSDVLT